MRRARKYYSVISHDFFGKILYKLKLASRLDNVRRSRPMTAVTLEFECGGIDLRTYLRGTSRTIQKTTIRVGDLTLVT